MHALIYKLSLYPQNLIINRLSGPIESVQGVRVCIVTHKGNPQSCVNHAESRIMVRIQVCVSSQQTSNKICPSNDTTCAQCVLKPTSCSKDAMLE